MNSKRNNTIDLLRFIISILIVPIHGGLFKDIYTPLYNCFTQGFVRLGVPFFFIASGFFLKSRVDRGVSLRKPGVKLLIIWIVCILLDLAITGWFYYPNFENVWAFLHKAFVVGLSDAYWFLPILIISQVILEPLFKRNLMPYTLLVGFLLYLFAMTHDSYSFLFEGSIIYQISDWHTKIFVWPQGGLVESIFFMSIGGIICHHKTQIREWFGGEQLPLIIAIVVFSVLLVFEAGFTQGNGAYDGNCYLSLIFLPVLLFLWAVVFDPVKFDTKKLGEASFYIYLIHPIAVSLMKMAGVNSIIKTLVATVIAVSLAFAIVFILDKRRQKMLLVSQGRNSDIKA